MGGTDTSPPPHFSFQPLETSRARKAPPIHHSVGPAQAPPDPRVPLSVGPTLIPTRGMPRTLCTQGQFACEAFGCVEAAFVCDGQQDCSDGSDEARCGECAPSAGHPPSGQGHETVQGPWAKPSGVPGSSALAFHRHVGLWLQHCPASRVVAFRPAAEDHNTF